MSDRFRSERDANAAFGGADAAAIGHRDAFEPAEYGDVGTNVIVEASTRDQTDGTARARWRECEILADQDGVDGAAAGALLRDQAAMQVGLQGVVAAEQGRHPGHVELTA